MKTLTTPAVPILAFILVLPTASVGYRYQPASRRAP